MVGPATQMVLNSEPILDQQYWISISCFQDGIGLYIFYNRRDAPRDDQLFAQQAGATAAAAICLSCYIPKTMWMYNV